MDNQIIKTDQFDPLIPYVKQIARDDYRNVYHITFKFPGNLKPDLDKIQLFMSSYSIAIFDEYNKPPFGRHTEIWGIINSEIGEYFLNKCVSSGIFDVSTSFMDEEEASEYFPNCKNQLPYGKK